MKKFLCEEITRLQRVWLNDKENHCKDRSCTCDCMRLNLNLSCMLVSEGTKSTYVQTVLYWSSLDVVVHILVFPQCEAPDAVIGSCAVRQQIPNSGMAGPESLIHIKSWPQGFHFCVNRVAWV